MERGVSNSSRNHVNPLQKSRKSASATPAGTSTSNIPAPTGSERPSRKSKTDAYVTAPWVGAAPTGSRKRAVSAVQDMDQPPKKVKSTSSKSVPVKSSIATQKAPRRKPAQINLDDDEDEDSEGDSMYVDDVPINQQHQPSKNVKSTAPSAAESEPIKSTTATQRVPPRKPATINRANDDINNVDSALAQSNSIKPTQRARRKPATISHDDGEEDDINNASRYRTNSDNDQQCSSASSERDENLNADDEDDLSEGDNDLSGLNSVSLQRKITSERPQWKNHSVKAAAHQDPADLFDDDPTDNYRDSDIPKVGYRDGTGSTASEFDGALDEPEQEDDDDVQVVVPTKVDEDSKSKRQKRSKKTTGSLSKRDAARLSEVPRWKSRPVAKHQRTSSEMESDNDCHDNQDVNNGWPEEAHYTPTLPNARNISIKEQPLAMKRMIRAAVNHITNSVLFDSAFPAAEKAEFEDYHRDAFVQCAKQMKHFEIVKRIQHDDELVKLIARVVNARISNLRTRCKKVTDGKVEGFYQLLGGEDAVKRVKSLTNENQDYIYPVNSNGTVNTKRPYFNPCIISSIKEFFFTGSRGSLAQKYEASFSSSIKDGPEKNELELPIPMVCLVATTNHASLDDWAQGYKRTKTDFRADTYESVYRGHELFLKTLQETNLAFYHTLMSDLYKAVASENYTRSAIHIANNAMARLNLPARTT